QVLVTLYDDLRDRPQEFLDSVLDFIGVPRFPLAESEQGPIHASEPMTYPRSYNRTRGASTMADWFKARRLHRIVAAIRTSPLCKIVLGGGPQFPKLSPHIARAVCEYLRPEIEGLETMLNRDLSAWKAMQDLESL